MVRFHNVARVRADRRMHDSVNIMPAYGPPGAVHFRFLKKRMVGACGVRWNLGTLYSDHLGDAIQ